MSDRPAQSVYGKIESWRTVWSASVHNCWIMALPMLIILSHRNIVGGMVLMVLFGTLVQPGLWPAAGRLFRQSSWQPGTGSAILAALIAFSLYVFLSVAWTPLKDEAEKALSILLFFLVSGAFLWTMQALPTHIASLLARFLLGAGALAIVCLGIEAVTGGAIRDIIPPEGRDGKDIIASARGTTIGLCLLPALLLLLWRIQGLPGTRPKAGFYAIAAVAVACLGAGALLFGVTVNLIALAAIIAAGTLALFRPKLALWLTAGGWAATFLLAPVAGLFLPSIEVIETMDGAPTSWVQRLAIWRFAMDNIFSGPLAFLFGGGVNYSQYLNDLGRTVSLPGYPGPIPLFPTHPHNLFVQIWLEFGLVGVLMVLGIIWLVVRFMLTRLEMLRPPVAAACLALAAGFYVICAVDLSLWTLWRLAAPVFALYIMIAAERVYATKMSR
ncbi:O-antigen ligase family protein [Parvularcula flava]|uniref:O-antigen ligase family protein n=1 Tax=Aquisalinus luteolus TaxID=1566827 RepID=A0A8J3ERI3_9PROT|nr:O-antigen ligase family protein [Aquisalinus luteolus]NHK28582.1 O-antigen ligase family protein [Aquisalinus luteolus]GGH98910.1 O-antigen polymerase [Aquisalinus luteolus]